MYSIQKFVIPVYLVTYQLRGQNKVTMTNVLTKNIVDLTDSANTAQALSKFETLLCSQNHSKEPMAIVLGNFVFTQGHMTRLKNLADQNNVEIEVVYTSAAQTQIAALTSGLTVSEKAPGDIILEEFKNSLHNICSDTNLENTQTTEHQKEETNHTENITFEVSTDEILIHSCGNNNVEIKKLNDVVEILNDQSTMVQQKIDLPFETNVDIVETISPTNLKEKTTLYINQTLRSGQVVTHKGNVVIAGDTHPGSEVIAGGDIIVWGTLSGIAHAGAGNNYKACIRALKLNAIQIRIADYIARKPDQKVDFKSESPIKPEVARISNGEIRIFSLK